MKASTNIELLKLLWHNKMLSATVLQTTASESATIKDYGEWDHASESIKGAAIVIGDTLSYGRVVIGTEGSRPELIDNDVILHVIPHPTTLICKDNGEIVPQLIVDIPEKMRKVYEQLRFSADTIQCAAEIKSYDPLRRTSVLTGLQIERIGRKCNDVMTLYAECEQDWNQTMYIMLLRTMGDNKNKIGFTELARRVPYHIISRERNSITIVEALLLGTSGLLENYAEDIYTLRLREDYNYLSAKYRLSPMATAMWDLQRINPNNHPIVRIVQLASFLATKDFVFDSVVNCRTAEDIDLLLSAEASEYWQTHYVPARISVRVPKRLGRAKKELLGINFISPLQAAYGQRSCSDIICESSIDILERLQCEDNRIVASWRCNDVELKSAFDSQAIIQLNNEYCVKGRCGDCLIGRNIIKEALLEIV